MAWSDERCLAQRLDLAEEKIGCLGVFLFAAIHDGRMQTVAHLRGEFVNIVAAVDFDGFARGIENDFTVTAAAQVSLQLRASLCAD